MATDHNAAVAATSSNPFRRRGPSSSASNHSPPPISVPNGLLSSFDTVSAPAASGNGEIYRSNSFRQQLQSLPKSAEAPPSTTFQRPKPVKKVRVQSPPPSSPESINGEFEARFPAPGPSHIAGELPGTGGSSQDDELLRNDALADGQSNNNYKPSGGGWEPQQLSNSTRPPPNPFSKTQSDLEGNSKNGVAANQMAGVKGSMDVDAFRRLLMTGQPGAPHAPANRQAQLQAPPPHHYQGDAASNTDTSSTSRQSIFDASNLSQETPRTSHEMSDEDEEHGLLSTLPVQRKKMFRKKPPPPVSRHGRPVSLGLSGQESAEDTGLASKSRSSSAGSDLNKPLPPAPRLLGGDVSESVFDREAAGKIPEVDVDHHPDAPHHEISSPRPPTPPPNASHMAAAPLPKKPAAPPPRRAGHGRSDSRAAVVSPLVITHAQKEEDTDGGSIGRQSSESIRSRSSSIRSPAPAPPPPRRSAATINPSRPGTGQASPGISRTPTSPSLGYAWPGGDGLGPLTSSASPTLRVSSGGAPPPPPARKNSVRSGRPSSVRSIDSISRRVDSSGTAIQPSAATPPPPPPPRPRGRGGSRTGPDGSSDSSAHKLHEAVPEEVLMEDSGVGKDILADLDALQREVDALRGLK